MAKITASDVKKARVIVEIDGDEYTLIPSPEAILGLSNKYGGLSPLNQAIGRVDVQAMVDIMIFGLSLEGKEAKDMAKAVIMSDKTEIAQKLSQFVMICANGGKPLKAETAEEEGSKGPL
jgi:hypothetical protein